MLVKQLIKDLQELDQEQEIKMYDITLGIDMDIEEVYKNEDGTYYI